MIDLTTIQRRADEDFQRSVDAEVEAMLEAEAAYWTHVDDLIDEHLLEVQARRTAANFVYQAIAVVIETPQPDQCVLDALDAALDALGVREDGE